MKIKRLSELKLNRTCMILTINIFDEKEVTRLKEMGLYKGSILKVIYYSSSFSPIIVNVNGYLLSINKDIACKIIVEEINEYYPSWQPK